MRSGGEWIRLGPEPLDLGSGGRRPGLVVALAVIVVLTILVLALL